MKNDKVRLDDGQTWKIKREIVERLNEPWQWHLIRTEKGKKRKHTFLRRGGNSDSCFKNETDYNEYLPDIYNKPNNTTNQTPDTLCNEVEETTNIIQTCSVRILKRPSRYEGDVLYICLCYHSKGYLCHKTILCHKVALAV